MREYPTGPNNENTISQTVPAKYPNSPIHSQVDRTLGAYKPPKGDQAPRYAAITHAALEFATLIADLCPPSAETTLAIRCVEDARMRANQAIAVNEIHD